MKERYEILQEIVKKSGKTQEEFANSIGLKKAAFNNYIKGRRDLPNTLMESLAKVYNINPAIFFDDTAPYSLSDIKQPVSATLSLVTETTAKLNEPRQEEVLAFANDKLKEQQLEEQKKSNNKYNNIDEETREFLIEYALEHGEDAIDKIYNELARRHNAKNPNNNQKEA